MILLKVEIFNIRTHGHLVFEPSLSGVTSISGENGAGKSTIVDSFAWCLFGTRLRGMPNKRYIKENVKPKEEYTGVISNIVVGNREYKIERRILKDDGSGECNIYSREVNSNNDFVFECGPTVSHSNSYIKTLLGTDEKGFFSSIFIQQKQVDQIINASPKERGLVIERLIGIDAISEASNMAKLESKTLQKAADIIQPGSLDDERLKVDNQKTKIVELENTFREMKGQYNKLKDDFLKSADLYKTEKIKQEKFQELDKEKTVLATEIKHLENELIDKTNMLSSISIDKTISSMDIETNEKQLEELKGVLLRKSVELDNLIKENKSLEDLFSKKVKDSVFDDVKQIKHKIEQLELSLDKNNANILILKEKIKHNKLFIEELNKGVANCPLCEHKIDNIETALKDTNVELQENEKELENTISLMGAEKGEKEELFNTLLEYQSVIDVFESQNENKERFLSIKNIIKTLENDIVSTESEIKILTSNVQKFKLQESNIKNVKFLKDKIKSLNKNIQEKKSLFNESIVKIEELNALSKKEFTILEQEFSDLSNTKTDFEIKGSQVKTEIEIAKKMKDEYEESYKKCEKAIKEFQELTKGIQRHNDSNDLLLGFKAERAKSSIPDLNGIASDMLSRFTNGEFIKVELNDNFEAFVTTKSGVVREVAQLSGGELSTVAIALRLSIAIFLNEGSQSLLILDEVLSSMSEERSQLILQGISELTQSQIVIIAHSEMINNFADKIVKL